MIARKPLKKLTVKSSVKESTVYKKPLAVGRSDEGYFLLVRQTSDKGEHELFLIESKDGASFTSKPKKVVLRNKNRTKEDLSKCRDFRFFCHEGDVVMTYLRRDAHDASGSSLVYAATKDKLTWVIAGEIKKIQSNGIFVPELGDEVGDAVYFGGDVLRVAVSKNTKSWNVVEPHRIPHWHFFDGAHFRVVGGLLVEDAIAIFYESEVAVDILADVNLHNQKVGEERFVKMGVALFPVDHPTRLLWQTELPLIELPLDRVGNFTVIGVVQANRGEKRGEEKNRTLRIYGTSQEGEVSFIEFSEKVLADHRHRKQITLAKHQHNPILKPTDHQWESDGAFNPTALAINDKVHLFYRAVGSDGLSRIGYAASSDGIIIDERANKPVYSLHKLPSDREERDLSEKIKHDLKNNLVGGEYNPFASGGSWGGCEDPKVTRIEDTIYLTYVAHNGSWPMRTAITSISVADFLKKKWKWKKPALMSPPNVGSKSVVLMSEKIDGQYVVFHRMWPNIMVDIVPDLEFGEGKRWLTGQHIIPPRRSYWDSQKLSMGASPIKTKEGWLAIYNAVDRRDSSKYKIGAMLLDLKDPRKVIARSKRPILSPDQWYENDGKPGIAYPGGAVELDGVLHVYYGGGDKVGCVATIDTENLVWHLLQDSLPHVTISPVIFS